MSSVERYKELRKQEISPTQTWARLKEEYVAQFRKQTTSGDAIESWKVKSGKAFEVGVTQLTANPYRQYNDNMKTEASQGERCRK